jgi:hypothetical protein
MIQANASQQLCINARKQYVKKSMNEMQTNYYDEHTNAMQKIK